MLEKLGFGLAEIQEEFFLLLHKQFRKIKVPKVSSWDLTGYPEKNIIRISTEDRHSIDIPAYIYEIVIKYAYKLRQPNLDKINLTYPNLSSRYLVDSTTAWP